MGVAARRAARALALACICSAMACSDDPAEPVISGFSAAASTITAGTSTTLTAVFANGAGTVDNGVGDVSSGVPKSTGTLTTTTAFTLTVSGEGGTRSSAVTVTVVPPPAQPVITAPSILTAGTTASASVPAQPGMSLEWTISGGTFAGGSSTAAGAAVTFTAGAAGTLELTCTAANAAGDRSAPALGEVTVVPAPVITGFVASKEAITAGGAVTLTATFADGTGTVDHGVGAVASGVAVDTGALWDTTTFLLTVTNAAGDSASAQVTVRLVIVFTTEGDGFSPVLTVDGAPAILWTFGDGTTSTSRTPQKTFDGATTRLNTLTVTPWSAVRRINVGYLLADGASASIETVPPQHVSAVEGLAAVRSTLGQWCSAQNELVSLDFTDFTNLDTLDCYRCTQLESVNLTHTPRLSRLSLEGAPLGSLDVSQSPALTDLRAALSAYPTIEFGDAPLAELWHVCVRDNPQLTNPSLFSSTARFPVLASLLVWSSSQAGDLRIPSSHPTRDFELEANDNGYTSVDLEGALTNPLARGVVSLDRNPVASLNLAGCVQITELYLVRTALGEAEQDGILATLDALGRARAGPEDTTPLVVDLRQNVIHPSAAGRAHAVSLASKGWTVMTNVWTEPTPP